MSSSDHVDDRRRVKAAQSRTDVTAAAWLLAAFTCLYLSTAKGVLEYGDDWSMLYVTSALADHRGTDIPADAPGAVRGADGRSYSKYGIGQSLTAVPFYVAGRALARANGHPTAAAGHILQGTEVTMMVTMVGVLASALSVALLFATCRTLGFSAAASFLTALALGIGTFAWHYSRTFMTEPTSMFALLSCVYLLLRWRRRPTGVTLALSGAAAGVTILLHLSTVVALPAIGVWLLWIAWDEGMGLRRAAGAALAWGLPVVGAVAMVAAYNLNRFGTISETGYGNPSDALVNPVGVGLYGFLLSSGKSIFVYAPILIASAAGWGRLWKRHRRVAACVALSLGCYLTFHAGLSYWWGGGAWGPRYATVLLPLMLLGLPALVDGGLGPAGRVCLIALGALSVLVQLASVFVPYIPYEAQMEATPVLFNEMLWNPAYSPVAHHIRALLAGTFDADFAYRYFQHPAWRWIQGGLFLVAVAFGAYAWRTCRRSTSFSRDDRREIVLQHSLAD